ncbi:protein NO VEIN isoform X2 [Kryptolebias marmoratus]|nr:protein NO VEIN isoform X2 [Kryptolebias marmoratus]XP_017271687.1 protein NO VEIN isoform X2 [Kryptolebias marmoratus]XP_024861701.1 protein NO VEIN isoform X2 [Kryptolebias marmoratus]XP_024861704.1 protein NO VEIN isoform X2 [Kryptolebias marmoratus]XP_037836614.1 protein NO VEIN isoform X2 [Kryptolebias marmoratus]XP_037836615.1 protein NO VEIN isoform X2 [Kryptolebias marmoratus]XP_037836616.1 protein NO VEIN isoform X2 [Kryptolebias marmoratus]XP_037836617.1 protein NO VEIN isoform 
MEEVLQNVVTLVKQHQNGIPVNKLAVLYNQKYHSNLSMHALHFSSMLSLVSSLEDLVVKGSLVFHKDCCHQTQAEAGAASHNGASTSSPEDGRSTKGVLKRVVALMLAQPDGILLKDVAIFYSQKYHQNLSLASLGFATISGLVESLGDLVVKGDKVFHKICLPGNQPGARKLANAKEDGRPGTPRAPESVAGNSSPAARAPAPPPDASTLLSQARVYLGSPLVPSSSLFSAQCTPGNIVIPASEPAQQLTQEQLFQRVLEVLKTYHLKSPSMDQLQTCYSHSFGEPFPLRQYMSLYDSLEGKNLAPKSESTANPKPDAWQTTEATRNPTKSPEKERQPENELNILAESDFPALGAAVSLTKEERKAGAKDATPKTATVRVFRDAYHAQLREVHGGNMRAVEAMEEDDELTSRRRNRNIDADYVNSVVENAIREIASEGELVTKEKVISRACQMLPSLDPRMLKPWTVPALKDLEYLMREINMFLEATEAVTSICTLYELGQSLAGLKDKKRYEELHLGPLCKLPLIHRMFKIDSNTKDDEIHEIQTVDILKKIRIFRRSSSKPKLDLAEFLQYLSDHYNCDSPYELGIRIHSFGLPIASLTKVSRAENLILERAREDIQKELEEETFERLRRIKKSVLETAQSEGSFSSTVNLDLRKKYVSMPAGEVVLEVLSNAMGVFSSKMTKHIEHFLMQVSHDRLARALFQLAVCGGSLAVPQDLVPKEKAPKTADQAKTAGKAAASLPSEAKVKQYLKDSLSALSSTITLANIAALEKKLSKHFHHEDFLSLGQGTFLEFLVKHMQLLQDTLGSALFLGSNMELTGGGFRPTRQDVFEFIKQCGDASSTEPDKLFHIESALRCHYRLRDSRDLGYGTLHMLAGLVQRQRELAGGGLSPVYYESALLAKHNKSSAERGSESAGRLGETSKAQALASLLCCPLLEDLSQWSQWELVFKPHHGSLKDFIERNAANTGLAALEETPGLLLRITTDTGDKHFSRAAADLEPVGTAGHLVSMVVADGIDNAPTALLANHMENSLAAAVAKEDLSQSEEDVMCYGRVAKFLLNCLIRIPTRTCQALLLQVFLEPFSRVLGQAKSKQVLITVAQSDPKHLNCLHQLGILLGVQDWVRDYQKKLSPTQNQNAYAARADQAQPNIDSESSSLSAGTTSEDDYLDDSSSVSSQLDHSLQQVNGDHVVKFDEEEDEEELYELASVANGEASDLSSDAEEQLEKPEPDEKDASSCQSETLFHQQRDVIEDIRKSEFGIGVELNAEGQKLMQVHQERLGRSLDRLSTELYSKDTHFVLELIQNADDNSYPSEAGVVPALAFVMEKDCITVLNNEIGFQEKNIRAICDVGCSTKGKHKYGYIGQKGIGFKSVFKVTDCPEIHSNGFHLHFDKTSGPMGYILPHWTEDKRPLDTLPKEINQHSWTTKICLPLRSESHQTRNLFHDVHPSLLLFLHRLRSITIYNQSEKRLVTMTRKDLSHNVLEVEHTEGVERWLVVKTTLQPKKIKEDVESTELALAFQLGSNVAEDDVVCQPQKQPVFAYLPLRSFGLRFIIQADFDIPSSREDVDRDSSWNQWLRSEIPQLFLQAMDVFIAHPDFRGLKGLCQFLQFIPLPDEVLDFFKPVAGQIIQLLKGKAFLPTLSSGGKAVYKLPSQVAVCQDTVIRDVIGGDELDKHLSLSYLHPGLSPPPPTSLLTQLGVRHIRGSDVTTVTTAMAKELVSAKEIHSEGGLRRLARLLVCNFRAMEHGYGEADSILQNLRDLPIVPLADQRVVALSGEGVFFPMEETKTKRKKARAQTGPLSELYKDLSVVHPSLLNCLEPLENQQVRELLKRLGVHELEPLELLEQHIYPTIRSDKWKSKTESVVVSYLVFIKQNSSSSQEFSDISIPVLTCRGLLCPATERVHFSEEYGNINLPKKLPGFDWILLSPCYVQTDDDVAGWRELLSRLGVRDGLIVRKERRTLASEELASSPWSAESAAWHRHPGGDCVLDDYACEEFKALATAQLPGSLLLQQRTALLELLEANWNTGHEYSQYITAKVIDSDGQPVKNTRSSFYHFLCHLEWVPAHRPTEEEQQERKFLRPSSVYLTSPEVTSLLGTHVFYVDLNSSEFSRKLGMRETISVDVLIQYLKEWCVEPEADDQETPPADKTGGARFTSTVQHIHSVYTYLQTNCSQNVLKELFQYTPAVFVESNRPNDKWCSGRFYHLKEVCWSDNTGMFQRYRQLTHRADSPIQDPRVLAPFYSQLDSMRDFFTRLLNVDLSPTMNQYVGLLELICSSSPMPTAEVLQDVSILYAKLAQKCKPPVSGDLDSNPQYKLNHSYCSSLKGMVSDKRVFPTKDSTWVSLAHKPMISDSKELEKVFKPRKVCLLNLPPPEKKTVPKGKAGQTVSAERVTIPAFNEKDRLLFLEICGIRQLSSCVKSEALTENLRPCPSMQSMAHSVVPYIQRFLKYHDELAEVYSELVHRNIAERIKHLNFAQVGKLYIRYQLDVADTEEPLIELQDVICLLKDEKSLYIQKDHLSDTLEICSELVKLFCTDSSHRKELKHFLTGLIASLGDPKALKRFLTKEDIRELPSDEEQWEVPEPVRPEPISLDRVLSRSHSSISSLEEPARPAPADGEQTLACWPPRASMQNTGSIHPSQAKSSVVEAVLKMWPPPASPKDKEPHMEVGHGGKSHEGEQPPWSGGGVRPAGLPELQRVMSHPGPPPTAAVTTSTPRPPERSQLSETGESGRAEGGEKNLPAPGPAPSPLSAQPAESSGEQPAPNNPPVLDAVVTSGTFQGTAAAAETQRPLLNLDFPLWNKDQASQATLEDMELTCQRPPTVVVSDEPMDLLAIGEWGERLVNSFLCSWRDGGDPARPTHVLWCNESGESGQPYDFKLTFEGGAAPGPGPVVFVEVKSTVRKEKSFIHLSANELDFALKEKDRYHIYRVYSAGDAQNVHLCRIRNLAQHLHTKDLALYLFV